MDVQGCVVQLHENKTKYIIFIQNQVIASLTEAYYL